MTTQELVVAGDPVAALVTDLDRRLVGPRRVRAAMVREVADGLHDAVDGRLADGQDRVGAARDAVAEFGDVEVVARELQVELAACQVRPALTLLAVLGPVSEVSSRIVWSHSTGSRPSETAKVFALAVDVIGWGGSLVAVIGLLLFGFGSRWWAFRPGFARLVGYGIVAKLGFMVVAGSVLTALFGDRSVAGAPELFGQVMGMLTPLVGGYAVWLAWRCVRVGRRAARPVG